MNTPEQARFDLLNTEGISVSSTAGTSMYPMLRNLKDTVIIKKPNGRLKKYDVALYRRDKKYVLHRIIKVLPDGYIIRGDNCSKKEYDITDAQILGVLDGFYRGEKYVPLTKLSYRIYIRLQHKILLPIKTALRRIKHSVKKLFKKK